MFSRRIIKNRIMKLCYFHTLLPLNHEKTCITYRSRVQILNSQIFRNKHFFFTDLLKFTCRTFKKVIMEQNKELIIILEPKNLKLRPQCAQGLNFPSGYPTPLYLFSQPPTFDIYLTISPKYRIHKNNIAPIKYGIHKNKLTRECYFFMFR